MKGMPGCPQPAPASAACGACSQTSRVRIQLCSLVAISPRAIDCIILVLSFLLRMVGVAFVSTLFCSVFCLAPQTLVLIKNIHSIDF